MSLYFPVLWDLAGSRESASDTYRRAVIRRRRRPDAGGGRRYMCPRPGVDTPLWNALAAAAASRLKRYGSKARMARFLGISRQRLHLLLVARSAYPDAERALLLQLWLAAGGHVSSLPPPLRRRRIRVSSVK